MAMDWQVAWQGKLVSSFTDQLPKPIDVCNVDLLANATAFARFRQAAPDVPRIHLTKAADKFITALYPVQTYCKEVGLQHCQLRFTGDRKEAWVLFVMHMGGWRQREAAFNRAKRKLAILDYGPFQGYLLPALYELPNVTEQQLASVEALDCWFYTQPNEPVPDLHHFSNPCWTRLSTGELELAPAPDAQQQQQAGPSAQPQQQLGHMAPAHAPASQYAPVAVPITTGHAAVPMPPTPHTAPVPVLVHAAAARPPPPPRTDAGMTMPHSGIAAVGVQLGGGQGENVSAGSTNTTGSPKLLQHAPSIPTVMGLHSSFLGGLAQNHESWAFGAIAELVDNARDAEAGRLEVFVTSCQDGAPLPAASPSSDVAAAADPAVRPMLAVLDDGAGMDYATMLRAMSMGHGKDEPSTSRIGCYGFGLKSGTMRLGADALILSIHRSAGSGAKTACVSLLSMTYNQDQPTITTPIIPMRWPSFELDAEHTTPQLAHQYWEAIQRVSGLSQSRVLYELGRIRSTGTLILIWNLRKGAKQYELQWSSDDAQPSGSNRAEPDITITGQRPRRREGQLKDCRVAMDWSLRAYLSRLYLETKCQMAMYVQGQQVEAWSSHTWKNSLVKSRVYRERLQVDEEEVQLALRMGVVAAERDNNNCGVLMYHKQRLILSYQRYGLQGFVAKAFGVVGLLQVPDAIRPTNNKQAFVETHAYAEVGEWVQRKVLEYYNSYISPEAQMVVRDVAVEDKTLSEWAMCETCSKWRRIPKELHDKLNIEDSNGEKPPFYCHSNQPYVDRGFVADCDAERDAVDTAEVTVALKQDGEEVKPSGKGVKRGAHTPAAADKKKPRPSQQ